MEKVYHKLIRDKIPQIIADQGDTPVTRILSDDEFKISLKQKLAEEAGEVVAATTREEVIEELADLWEVTNKIIQAEGILHDDIEKARIKKLADRGGFEDKVFLEKVIQNEGA